MSTQPTLAQDRVVDPIYTQIARGYTADFAPIANLLFPFVDVDTHAGKIVTFGPEDFILVNTARAPGQNTKRVQFGHAGADFALVDHRLEALIPLERIGDTAVTPGIDLVQRSVRGVQRTMDIEREYIGSQLARNAAVYDAGNKVAVASADKWSNDGSDPFSQVDAAKAAVRKKVGQKPNVMVLGDTVYSELKSHPAVIDRLGNASIKVATKQQLELLFEIRIEVGEGVYYNQATKEFVDIWGNDVILAVVAPASVQDMGSPNFGYTYRLRNRPLVEQLYEDRNANSWIAPVVDAYKPVLTGVASGYLFQGAV